MQMVGELKARTTGCLLAYNVRTTYGYTHTLVHAVHASSKLYILSASSNWYMPVTLEKPRVYCLQHLLILKPKDSSCAV